MMTRMTRMVMAEPSVADVPSAPDVPKRGFASFVELLLLDIPQARAPGLTACGVTILRLLLIPLTATLAVFLPLAIFAPTLLDGADGAMFADSLGDVVVFGALALTQETSRYAFVRRAQNPDQALALFASLIILVFSALLLARGADLYTLAWVLAGEVAAGLAMRQGLPYAKDRIVLVFGLVVAHAALYIYAPAIGRILFAAPLA